MRRSDALAAWYRLTPTDRDPRVFAAHLLGSLGQVLPSLSKRPGQIVAARGVAGFGTAFGLLCDDLAGRLDGPLVLVLDDCHHLPGAPEVAQALETFVTFFPESSQVVFAGRAISVAGLEGWRARGELVAIEDGDLAFTPDEIAGLLGQEREGTPPPGAAQGIAEWTRGWAIAVSYAVRLGAQTARPGPCIERPEELVAFLAREVLPGLDAAFASQLVRCAHLSRVGPAECSALFGAGGPGFLEALGRFGTFVSRVGDGFEFHPLFREVLVREFQAALGDRERHAVLIRLAELAGSPPERVRCLLLADDWRSAEAELARALPVLFAQGQDVTVRDLLDGFPSARRETSAFLRLTEGRLLVREGRAAPGSAILREAERLAEIDRSADLLGWIWAALANASVPLGQPEEQARYATQALAVLPSDAAQPRSWCHNALGMLHLRRRDRDAAEADFEAALQLCRLAGDVAGEVRASQNLGCVAVGRGTT